MVGRNEQIGAIAFEREGAHDGGGIGKAGRMAYDSAGNKDLLYGRQGGACVGCLQRFPRRNMTVDHIRPQSMGGGHGIGNLQLLCAACNSLKGSGSHEALIAKLLEAGVIVLTRRGKYAPAGGRGLAMNPLAVSALVAVAYYVTPYAVAGAEKAVKKYGPGLAEAAKKYRPVLAERARSAGRVVADGAGSAGRTVADGADRARERARRWRGQGAEADGEAPPEKDQEPL